MAGRTTPLPTLPATGSGANLDPPGRRHGGRTCRRNILPRPPLKASGTDHATQRPHRHYRLDNIPRQKSLLTTRTVAKSRYWPEKIRCRSGFLTTDQFEGREMDDDLYGIPLLMRILRSQRTAPASRAERVATFAAGRFEGRPRYSARPARSSASPSSAFLSGFAKRADRTAVETVRVGST
jgi:hypothetical protein